MLLEEKTLPADAEALKTMVMELATENTYLREQIRLLTQKRFGASSEKLSEEQLLLMLDGEGVPTTPPEPLETIAIKGHQRARGGRRPLPENLERIEVVHDLSPEEKICPHDGHQLKRIGQETSEQLSYKQAEMRVLLHVRPKYACPVCEEGVAIAPPPAQLIPKSMAAPSLLAHVAVSKYVDALPLYRQEQIFLRHGVDLPRSTVPSWMIHSGQAVPPLINLLRDELRTVRTFNATRRAFRCSRRRGARPKSSPTCGRSEAERQSNHGAEANANLYSLVVTAKSSLR